MNYYNRPFNGEESHFTRRITLSLCMIFIFSSVFIIYLLLIKCNLAALGFGSFVVFIIMLIFWISPKETEYTLLIQKKYFNPSRKKSHFDIESSIKTSKSTQINKSSVLEKEILKDYTSEEMIENPSCCCDMKEIFKQIQTIDCCSECAKMRLEMDELLKIQASAKQLSNPDELLKFPISDSSDLEWYLSLKRVGKDAVMCQLKNKENTEVVEKSESNKSKRKRRKRSKSNRRRKRRDRKSQSRHKTY